MISSEKGCSPSLPNPQKCSKGPTRATPALQQSLMNSWAVLKAPAKSLTSTGPTTKKRGEKKAQVISPTAYGALFSARTTPQPWQNLGEPWWNPGGTLVAPWWNPSGTLVEPWWNPRGTFTSGPPRTTPEPICAETPKLAAVGGKNTTTQDSVQ